MKNKLLGLCGVVCLWIVSTPCPAAEPSVELLWPDGAPGAVGSEDGDRPSLTIYRPSAELAQPTAVIVFPGGGYAHLAVDHEGKQIADWLNSLGVTACVLKYRLAPRYHHPAPLSDAQRAVRTVRSQAKELGIAPDRIGVIGFSAGGHLASSAGTHFDAGKSDSGDPIEQLSCRPDFLMLGYPVISFTTEYVHGGSRQNLLGENPPEDLVKLFSNELQVTDKTPPTFLVHSSTDTAVPPENSVLFYMALRRAGVPAELHIFEQGPHGFGLGQKDPALKVWPEMAAQWMVKNGWLAARSP